MTDLQRNTRTLVICFVVGLFSLLPLRFYEEGQLVEDYNRQILGAYSLSEEVNLETVEQEPIVESGFEAPYAEMEVQGEQADETGEYLGVASCISFEEAMMVNAQTVALLDSGAIDDEQRAELNRSFNNVMEQVCRD